MPVCCLAQFFQRPIALTLLLSCIAVACPVYAAITITISPESALLDQRVAILVSGLHPKTSIRVSAKSQAQDSLWWRSEAQFISDDHGQLNLDGQAPESGSYREIDGMGLFWSMRPDKQPKGADHLTFSIENFSKPVITTIEVTDADGAMASTLFERCYAMAGVRSVTVTDEVTATLYEDAHDTPLPGVLVIGGSDGGAGAPGLAMLLAAHGYAALSLSYFAGPNLPATLENIPLEYFEKALVWMRSRPDIDPRFIAIYGESRGSEAALFTAASDSHVSAVVARSPSFALWSGVTAARLPGKPAWTLAGQPQPYIANTLYPDFIFGYLWDRATGTPVRQTHLFLEDLAHAKELEKVSITVEQIHGPIMLLSGADDQIWPSPLMAKRIMSRLRSHAHSYPDRFLEFADVGHAIPYVYLPTRGNWQNSTFAVGCTAEGMAKAEVSAVPQILKFLSDAKLLIEQR